MRLFGLEITRAKALSSVPGSNGGWLPLIREPFAGAWQRNKEISPDTVLAHHAVYACITLIASDMGKMRAKLVQKDADGIWSEVSTASPFHPVLRKPNRYQNHIQFKEWWATSKLVRGNTYALKERDSRGVVRALYLLDPSRVQVLVAPNGEVFYQLQQDNLSGLLEEGGVTVPAREIIHDRINCLFHPLVGVSPIYAAGMAAQIGLSIERNADGFFGRGSNPSGILTAPTEIKQETAERLSDRWEKGFGGSNSGKVAVLGSGLDYKAIRMTAVDAQMIEHLKWTAENVASAFHVPPFKIGVGTMPTYQNGEILDQRYYSDCLQSHIEQFELCMDEGLGIGEGVTTGDKTLGVELDLDALLRMDSATQIDTLVKGTRGSVLTPNEARRKLDLAPLEGGDTIYLQHQDYPMEKVFNRTDLDAKPEPSPTPPAPAPDDEEDVVRFVDFRTRTLRLTTAA